MTYRNMFRKHKKQLTNGSIKTKISKKNSYENTMN